MTKPTAIYDGNQAALGIMAARHLTSRVQHKAVPIAIIREEEIKNGNAKGKKIPEKLNQSDIGTKPLSVSSLHIFSSYLRGQQYYPAPDQKHGRLIQLELVNHNEIENEKSD
jgi:hypothetical protein